MAAHERGEEEEEEGKDKGRGLSRRNAYLGRNFLLCQELFNEANKTRKFSRLFLSFHSDRMSCESKTLSVLRLENNEKKKW